VHLKKDFDANQANKRLKFDTFLQPPAVILDVLSENRLLFDHGDKQEIVFMYNVLIKI
jgi:hypothetical protein